MRRGVPIDASAGGFEGELDEAVEGWGEAGLLGEASALAAALRKKAAKVL